MSEEAWGFAPPPFRAEEALQRLRRELREMGLSEREGQWEQRSRAIARLTLQDGVILAQRVTRPVRAGPQWQSRTLKSAADVRDFSTQLKTQLAHWSDDHD